MIHSKEVEISLRGRAFQWWVEESQKRWFGERVVAVVWGGDAPGGSVSAYSYWE